MIFAVQRAAFNWNIFLIGFILDIDYIKPLQKTCETFASRTLLKNSNSPRAAKFLDTGRIWPTGRRLHTPGVKY